LKPLAHAPRLNLSVKISSYEDEVCGQLKVINLFRDENKCAKKFLRILADRKGNFPRDRSRTGRTKFCADHAIAHGHSGSHRAPLQSFARPRISAATSSAHANFSSRAENILLIALECSGNRDDITKTIR
jgi:hypothetical protein